MEIGVVGVVLKTGLIIITKCLVSPIMGVQAKTHHGCASKDPSWVCEQRPIVGVRAKTHHGCASKNPSWVCEQRPIMGVRAKTHRGCASKDPSWVCEQRPIGNGLVVAHQLGWVVSLSCWQGERGGQRPRVERGQRPRVKEQAEAPSK